jgi:GT2 family glycosyltransferase
LRKGWRPVPEQKLLLNEMITGACMVMRRSLAQELGGFDEAYMIGDFEDCDLCWKIKERKLKCAVDHEVQLYHLERKSQVGPGQRWRMNLTLYNAWVHQNRWFPRRVEARSRADG